MPAAYSKKERGGKSCDIKSIERTCNHSDTHLLIVIKICEVIVVPNVNLERIGLQDRRTRWVEWCGFYRRR